MNFLISSSLILFINFAYIHLLLTRKRSIKYTLIMFLINYIIVIMGCILSYVFLRYIVDLKNIIYFKYIIYIIACSFIIYISLVFEESISKKIFTMLTIWLFSNVILIICSHIIGLFDFKNINLYEFPFSLLRIFIQLAFIPIIYFYFRRAYKEMLTLVNNRVINVISFYCIITYIFLISQYDLYSFNTMSSHELFKSLLFVILIILSYIIIFIAIGSANKSMELEYKFKIMDTQIELQKQNYINLNKSLKDYYEFKHEMRHHLLAIKLMLDAKNYIAVSEYFDKLNKNEICQNVGVLCRNYTIDSILKHYTSIAMQYSIDFKVNVNMPQDINMDNIDLSIVIGNCVENAIEACNNIVDKSRKFINLKAEIIGSQLVIKITNSFNGQIKKEGSIIKTSKNGEGHGIGLSNVRKIAEKYNGYFNVKYNDNKFEVCIAMNFN